MEEQRQASFHAIVGLDFVNCFREFCVERIAGERIREQMIRLDRIVVLE